MNNKQVEKAIVVALAGIATVLYLSGCSALGVKHAELWKGGPSMDFAGGQDFHIGTNHVDNVQNHRGLTFEPNVARHHVTTTKGAIEND